MNRSSTLLGSILSLIVICSSIISVSAASVSDRIEMGVSPIRDEFVLAA
jgi:hypothetical protein